MTNNKDWLEKIIYNFQDGTYGEEVEGAESCIDDIRSYISQHYITNEEYAEAERRHKKEITDAVKLIQDNYVTRVYHAEQMLNAEMRVDSMVTKEECEKRVLEARQDTYRFLIGWCDSNGNPQFDADGLKEQLKELSNDNNSED